MRNDTSPLPILAAVLGVGLLSVMDGVIKALAQHYSTLEIGAGRFLVGSVVAAVIFALWRAPWPGRETLIWNVVRGLIVVVSALTFFGALALLPLAEAIAISFIAPILIVLFGRVFLKEPVSGGIMIALGLGAAGLGVMLIDKIGTEAARGDRLLGIVLVVVSCVTYAASQVLLRARTAHDPLPTILFLQNLVPGVVIVPFAVPGFVMPAEAHWPLFIALGTLGALGHLCIAWAFSRAPATRVGPTEYTAFVWAVAIGWIWFAEVPSIATWIGAALIVAAAVIVGRGRRQAMA